MILHKFAKNNDQYISAPPPPSFHGSLQKPMSFYRVKRALHGTSRFALVDVHMLFAHPPPPFENPGSAPSLADVHPNSSVEVCRSGHYRVIDS